MSLGPSTQRCGLWGLASANVLAQFKHGLLALAIDPLDGPAEKLSHALGNVIAAVECLCGREAGIGD